MEKIIISKLLKISKEIPDFHTLSPSELTKITNISQDIWYEFLNNNEEIRQYIHRRTNEDIEIAHRKAMQALGDQASNGNVQAIKELNNLSGILNQNNNKQIVTHYIPRPKRGGEETGKASEANEAKEARRPHDLPQL
jgi:hypothetical protein